MSASSKAAAKAGEMTLVEHLTELRTRIIRSVLAVGVGAIVCFIFRDRIMDFLIEPYCKTLLSDDSQNQILEDGCALVQTQPLEQFSVVITVSVYGGIAMAVPMILWQLWQFIVPGLYPHEKRYAIPFVASGAALFFLGAGLAYWSIPRALDFLLNIGGDQFAPLLGPGPYLSFVVKMVVAFGIGFQFPLILIFLQIMGILDTKSLQTARRYAIVGIVVLVAVLTPSGDPVTLLVLSIPMYIFYEAAIVWGLIRNRRLRKASKSS